MINIMSTCICRVWHYYCVMKRSPPIETWGGETNGWRVCLSVSIVLYVRLRGLLGGELGMMPVRVCVRVLCSYSQSTPPPPLWSLATRASCSAGQRSAEQCRAVQALGVDMSRRY